MRRALNRTGRGYAVVLVPGAQAVQSSRSQLHAPVTSSGTDKQVRYVLEIRYMPRLYLAGVRHIDCAAEQFLNVGGAVDNSLSLAELFSLLKEQTSAGLHYDKPPARYSDQHVFVANLARTRSLFDWIPQISTYKGIVHAVACFEQRQTSGG